jgi:glycosyltransferase involved in cell wall biosynthesis
MRIVYLADHLTEGGLETHVISFVNELLDRGHHIILVAVSASTDVLDQILDPQNHFQFIPWKSNLLEVIHRFNPDIVHAHPFSAIIKGADIAKELGKPYIVSVHGNYDFGLDRSPTGLKVSQHVSRIIAVDQRVVTVLLRSSLHPEKVSVIRNGINLKQYVPLPKHLISDLRVKHGLQSDCFTIVTVCRLADGKQNPVIQLLKCANRISNELGGLNVVVVGGGAHINAVKEAMDEALQDQNVNQLNIRMMGSQQNIPEYIGLSDIVMACGRSALEALACQRPVFGMQYGFSGPIHQDNHHDVLFNISGFQTLTDQNLIKSIVQLAKDSSYRETLANDGVNIVKRYYDISNCVDQLERIYEQYISS